jgi:hypothetical protein
MDNLTNRRQEKWLTLRGQGPPPLIDVKLILFLKMRMVNAIIEDGEIIKLGSLLRLVSLSRIKKFRLLRI